MTGPTWLIDLVAAAMLATAAYCTGRVVVARLWDRATQTDVDLAHVAMGVGMADMLLRPPGAALSRIGLLGFTAIGGYFLARGIQHVIDGRGLLAGGQHLQHAVGCGAMMLMFVPIGRAAGSRGMAGMAGRSALGGASPATTAVALLLLALAVASVGRLVTTAGSTAQPAGLPSSAGYAVGGGLQRPLTPRLAVCCQALMSAAMCYLLLAV